MSEESRSFRKTRTGIVTSDSREKQLLFQLKFNSHIQNIKKSLRRQENYMHMMKILTQKLVIL